MGDPTLGQDRGGSLSPVRLPRSGTDWVLDEDRRYLEL